MYTKDQEREPHWGCHPDDDDCSKPESYSNPQKWNDVDSVIEANICLSSPVFTTKMVEIGENIWCDVSPKIRAAVNLETNTILNR